MRGFLSRSWVRTDRRAWHGRGEGAVMGRWDGVPGKEPKPGDLVCMKLTGQGGQAEE